MPGKPGAGHSRAGCPGPTGDSRHRERSRPHCWLVFDSEDRALYTNCLGNLVLTNDNSVYSNYCFTRKRDGAADPDGKPPACYRTSVLKQEQELAKLGEWTPAQVRQRQEKLAQWATKRWELGPDQPPATVTGPAVTGEEDLDDDADTDPLLASNPEDITD